MSQVYEELRRLAAHKLANELPGQTLQATALVHEAWLRVDGAREHQWQNRAHFFAAAAEAMRRILIERARKKMAQRHGGGAQHVDISEIAIAAPADADELLRVNEAIERLTVLSPRKAQLVILRYFAGLTFEEAAEILGIAVPTAKQWWAYARSWLTVELGDK